MASISDGRWTTKTIEWRPIVNVYKSIRRPLTRWTSDSGQRRPRRMADIEEGLFSNQNISAKELFRHPNFNLLFETISM